MRLNSIDNINSALAAFANNGDIRPDKFYTRILEDTIKVPLEDYVHVQQATQVRELDPAYQRLNLRRLGSWTPHTEVLKEGIPPRPDLTRSESINISYMQFGRFAYFTDQIRTDVLDDFVAHYTKELADLANRTLEKFAREKLLSTPTRWIAGGKSSIGKLVPGDVITIADLRLMVARLERELVKPIGGVFHYICSPEFMYDLLDDPYIENYMRINQSTFNMYNSGEPVSMFKLKFFSTRLDENLAPDIDHPGEYLNSNGGYELRLVNAAGNKIFSLVGTNASSTFTDEAASGIATALGTDIALRAILTEYYYRDGSAIENRVFWKLNKDASATTNNVKNVYKLVNGAWVEGAYTDILADDIDGASELPIHRGILTGSEGLIHVRVKGQGSAQIIIKELGSGGTNDPLNQLSSIGFKLRGVGFGFLRPEAVYATYGVPYHAIAMSNLTTKPILGPSASWVNQKGVDEDSFNNPADLGIKKWEAGKPTNTADDKYADPVEHIVNRINVKSVKITAAGDATTIATNGGALQLTATIKPANATDKTVVWASSDITKATVSASGVVTAVGNGAVTIVANASGQIDMYNITISNQT